MLVKSQIHNQNLYANADTLGMESNVKTKTELLMTLEKHGNNKHENDKKEDELKKKKKIADEQMRQNPELFYKSQEYILRLFWII